HTEVQGVGVRMDGVAEDGIGERRDEEGAQEHAERDREEVKAHREAEKSLASSAVGPLFGAHLHPLPVYRRRTAGATRRSAPSCVFMRDAAVRAASRAGRVAHGTTRAKTSCTRSQRLSP